MTGIRVTILRHAGSVPREAGTQMMVRADRTEGTIGGGALEWQAMQTARAMLAGGRCAAQEIVPLGPALGQCCGGSVTLGYQAAEALQPLPATPVWIYGAGHVGRALVGVLAPLPQWQVVWVDTGADRFPDVLPDRVDRLVAADPVQVVPHAPGKAHHVIMTYSHRIDLALCHAILSRDFAAAGVIGSATKWARFRKRLAALGHRPEQIARIACPIGDPGLGKHPQEIAVGVAAAMIGAQQSLKEVQTG